MLTPYACREAGYEVSVHCAGCRVLRPLDLLPFVLGPYDLVSFEEMHRRRLFKCHKCGSKDAAVFIDRRHGGLFEKVERWPCTDVPATPELPAPPK